MLENIFGGSRGSPLAKHEKLSSVHKDFGTFVKCAITNKLFPTVHMFFITLGNCSLDIVLYYACIRFVSV